MKREESIPNYIDDYPLTFVSVFPKGNEKDYFGKKLLYFGDDSGVLQIYEVFCQENKIKFQLKSKFKPLSNKEPIETAIIFFDKFCELRSPNEKFLNDDNITTEEFLNHCYIMMVIGCQIVLFKNIGKNSHDHWILLRTINKPISNYSGAIVFNYFYDETSKKTRFYFGFSREYIAAYDLKTDSWRKTELKLKDDVTSLNFIYKRKIRNSSYALDEESHLNKWFFIYIEDRSNSLIVGSVETGKLVRKIELENVYLIYDCCVWSDGSSEIRGIHDTSGISYLILCCGMSHMILILDFDTFEILFKKEMNMSPNTVVKVKRLINEEKSNEELACFFGHSLVFYEKKKD